MRYAWDDGAVELDGERIASTGAAFWARRASIEVDGEPWSFGIDPSGMRAVSAGGGTITVARGAPWRARSRVEGPSGEALLERTTSWLLGRLHFDVVRDGAAIGEIAPTGPWRYRPALEPREALSHAEAVFFLWCAYRIDSARPVRRIEAGPAGVGAAGG